MLETFSLNQCFYLIFVVPVCPETLHFFYDTSIHLKHLFLKTSKNDEYVCHRQRQENIESSVCLKIKG